MNKKKSNKKGGLWLLIIILVALIILAVVIMNFMSGSPEHIDEVKLQQLLNEGALQSVTGQTNGVIMRISGFYNTGAGSNVRAFVFDGGWTLGQWNNGQGVPEWAYQIKFNQWTGIPVSFWASFGPNLISLIIMLAFYGLIFYFLFKGLQGPMGGGANPFGMSKNKARLVKSTTKFSDVAGIDEEKEEVQELVDYLKNPKKYEAVGARAPKGVLLEGPPGTGKTLLAKAVAGEADVNFFSISGSEFEEMFVGLGASRIRDLFNDAKQNAPCIIFIDEIDAVGHKRTGGITGTNDQTLNQLLVEMDGFGTNSGVIVMAATNRSDVLDPALLRPGRFDRVVKVSLPDIKEREQILKLHARNKKIAKNVDWYRIAQRTPGFSGAQLENVLNEAAILMIRENLEEVTVREIDEAIDRVVGGPAKKSRAMTLHDKDIVSYHESGHALIGLKLESASKVQKVTIIPRGDAGGYTIMTPKDETIFQSKKDLYASITGFMGGRAAEEIIFGKENITTGAHDDLDKATNIAKNMVVQLGMSDKLGLARLLTAEDVSYGRSAGSYSETTATDIDKEVQKILNESYAHAKEIILANMEELHLLAESLKVTETITAEQIDYIDKNLKLPEEVLKEKKKYEKEEEKLRKGEIIDIDLSDVEKSDQEIIKETEKELDLEEKLAAKKKPDAKPKAKKPAAKKSTTKKAEDKPKAKKKPKASDKKEEK